MFRLIWTIIMSMIQWAVLQRVCYYMTCVLDWVVAGISTGEWPWEDNIDTDVVDIRTFWGCELLRIVSVASIKFTSFGTTVLYIKTCHSHFWRVRRIAKSDYLLRRVCPSAWSNSAPNGRIFMKFDILGFFKKSTEKIQVSSKCDKTDRCVTLRPVYICDISLNSS